MVLNLDSSTLIGKGKRREVYFHPADENKCIKIVVVGGHKETLREQSYYRLFSERNISWSMLAQFYGNIETNHGKGAVFELVRDYNGDVSKTLDFYLSSLNEPDFDCQKLLTLLPLLKEYLLEWKILTISINPRNIVYKKMSKTDASLVIIDNIGNADFIPICNWFDIFAVRKIRAKWRRFENLLNKKYNQNQALQQILKEQNY